MKRDFHRFVALAVVAAGLPFTLPAWATFHQITVQSFNFNPSDLTVAQGDTVQWVWVNGSHTVTSGTPCTADGLFSSPINSTHPSFQFVFGPAAGDYPYFCIPHCSMGMTGIVRVTGSTVDVREESAVLPRVGVQLLPATPNPFPAVTHVRYALAEPGVVDIAVFDAQGRSVALLTHGVSSAGEHALTWDGRSDAGEIMPSGAYYVRAATAQGTDRALLILVR